MKNFLTSLFILLSVNVFAEESDKLTFNQNGEFKIAQFTDLHLGNDWQKNQNVYTLIGKILDDEKPDFVIFTGDVVVRDDVQGAWDELAKVIYDRRIRWTAVLGNHDEEHKLSRKELEKIIEKQPGVWMKNVPQHISGACNQVIPVYDRNGQKVEALMYCFDSHGYSRFESIKKYDWIDLSQLVWYREQSRGYTQQNNDTSLPALAFLHIPFPEYIEAWESMNTNHCGTRNEKGGIPPLNSGLFTQITEAGDVMGVFAGHDHVNDYIACLHGVALGYGRGTGGNNTYGDQIPGGRIIVLKEGERKFDTWLRERDNTLKINSCSFPDSFGNQGPASWGRKKPASN